jgi:hypothetical protein
LQTNVLRLDRPTVSGLGWEPRELAFPEPYWRLSGEYAVTVPRNAYSYSGELLPVESKVSRPDLQYSFRFAIEFDAIVDSAQLLVNGHTCGARAWAPWRWHLPGLRPGRDRLDLVVYGTAGNRHELHWPDQPQGWIGSARLAAGS